MVLMGIMGSSYSFSSFWAHVPTDVAEKGEWVVERLQRLVFKEDVEGLSKRLGWVTPFEPYGPELTMDSVIIGEFALFTMRIDERKVPNALVKKHLAMEEARYKEEKGIKKVPRAALKRLKEKVEFLLLQKALPVPAIYDVAWDLEAGKAFLFSVSPKIIGEFQGLFKKTFDIMPVPIVPFTLASDAYGKESVGALEPELFI